MRSVIGRIGSQECAQNPVRCLLGQLGRHAAHDPDQKKVVSSRSRSFEVFGFLGDALDWRFEDKSQSTVFLSVLATRRRSQLLASSGHVKQWCKANASTPIGWGILHCGCNLLSFIPMASAGRVWSARGDAKWRVSHVGEVESFRPRNAEFAAILVGRDLSPVRLARGICGCTLQWLRDPLRILAVGIS